MSAHSAVLPNTPALSRCFLPAPTAPAPAPAHSSSFSHNCSALSPVASRTLCCWRMSEVFYNLLDPIHVRMLPEPSGTFPEPPIMSVHLFLIPNIPIRNPGFVHPQARLDLDFASDTTTSIPLAVHLTHPRMEILINLSCRPRTCPDVPSVTTAAGLVALKSIIEAVVHKSIDLRRADIYGETLT